VKRNREDKKNQKGDSFISGAAAQPRWLAGHRAGTVWTHRRRRWRPKQNSREKAEPLPLEIEKKEKGC